MTTTNIFRHFVCLLVLGLALAFANAKPMPFNDNDLCPFPMRKVTKAEAEYLEPYGYKVLQVQWGDISTELPKIVLNPKKFNAVVMPTCTDGLSHRWHISFRNADNKTVERYFTKTAGYNPCTTYDKPYKFVETHFAFGGKSLQVPDQECKKVGWRPMRNNPFDPEENNLNQLMVEVFVNKLMPYSKTNRPAYFCNTGGANVIGLDMDKSGACFKVVESTVKVDGTTYGPLKQIARVWGEMKYKCYGEKSVQRVFTTSTMPFNLECLWNISSTAA